MNIAINRIDAPRRTDAAAPAVSPLRRFAYRLRATACTVAAAITAAHDTRVPF